MKTKPHKLHHVLLITFVAFGVFLIPATSAEAAGEQSCELIASDNTIVEGENTTLFWQTSGGGIVTLSPGIGQVTQSGFVQVSPIITTTYTLTVDPAVGEGPSIQCQITITVTEPPELDPPVCDSFTASDNSVAQGDFVSIRWQTTHADDVFIDNGIGVVPADGSRSVRIFDDITYQLTVSNEQGFDTCSVTIFVDDDDDDDAVCDSFTVSDDRVDEGDTVTLRWRTSHADDVSINQGIGDVPDDGSERVRVFDDTTFRLTARNDHSVDTCSVRVNVDEDDDDDDEVRCDSFTVSDDDVDEGDTVTLRWRTSNADDVDINQGVGDVPDDGSRRIRVFDDTTFRLTARGNGDTDTCSVRVDVEEHDDDDVQCDSFTASDYLVDEGDYVTLRWRTSHADDVYINNGVGDVRDDGSRRVRVFENTTFRLTARDNRDTDTCSLYIVVDRGQVAGVSFPGNRYQSGLPLAGLPYTGFEAGPFLTFIFYLAIALWSAVIAYVLLIKKRANRVNSVNQEPEKTTSSSTVSSYEEADKDDASDSMLANLPTEETQSDEDIPTHADETLRMLEEHAHTQYTLVSSDALKYIETQGETLQERMSFLDKTIEKARKQYPKEGDWLILNKERVISVLQ